MKQQKLLSCIILYGSQKSTSRVEKKGLVAKGYKYLVDLARGFITRTLPSAPYCNARF